MLRRHARGLLFLALAILPCLRASDELNRQIQRIFDSPDFRARSFGPARWVEGGAAYTTVEPSAATRGAQDIVRYDTAAGKREVLVPAAQLVPAKGAPALRIENYAWSADARRLLVFTQSRKVWRQNTRGDYWVLDRPSGVLKQLGGGGPASSLMFAKFSPDGSRVAYVRANDLYVEDIRSGAIRRLTSNGSGTLINGTSDWVYEEELNLRDAFRWSPDGRSLAYWQFDSSGVQQFALINYTDSLYPKLTYIPYPKAGTTNSAVRIGVVPAAGGKTDWVRLPGDARDRYLFRMDWAGNSRELAIGQLNRLQNTAVISLADIRTGRIRDILRDQDAAWVDVPEAEGQVSAQSYGWLDGGKSLLWLSDRDGWRHAWVFPRDGGEARPISTGNTDIVAIEGVDPWGHWMYYLASPDNATQRYLFRAPLDHEGPPERLSPAGEPGTHRYQMSPDCRWAFHTWSRFDQPPAADLVSLPGHAVLRVLEENDALRAAVAPLLDPPAEFLHVKVSDGTELDGWLLKPPHFDPSRKYPLLVYVYGEPASATVTDAWSANTGLFHRALARDGYLVASFDNRGTPAPKGRAWRKSIYGSVGVLSTEDQTDAVLALARERPYVDAARIAVWGWSGGGTHTLNLMFRSPGTYKVGVAVAPVPDQRFYDTIYQERYMGLPDGNQAGYRSGSAIHFAEGLKGKLLIIHGTGDDNVHFQGTQTLINRLVELGKPFDFMEYPNRTHSISEGKGTTLHVYSLIARYIEEHL